MNLYALVPIASVAVYAVLLHHALALPHKSERRAFIRYLAASCGWSLVSFVLHVDEPLLNRYALIESRLLIVSFILMGVTYYLFLRAYVGRYGGLGSYLPWASIPVMALLAGLGFLPEDARTEHGVLYIEHGWALYVLAAAGSLMVVHGAALLISDYRSAEDAMHRTRTTYLLIGISVLTVAGFTNLNDSLARYPIDHLGSLINALLISYAVHKYRFLEIRFVIRRGLVYSISSATVVAAYLVVLFAFHRAFLGLSGEMTLLLAALLAISLAMLAIPLRSFAEQQVDRLFFSDIYEYRQLMLSFSNQTSGVLDLGRLADVTLQTAVRAVGSRWAGMLFKDPGSGDYTLQFSVGEVPPRGSVDLSFRKDEPLVTWLANEQRAIRTEMIDVLPAARGMWAETRDALGSYEVNVICPIIYSGNVSSVLLIGAKDDGTRYSEEHLELLITMANGLGAVIENARFVDSLRKQQQRTEQLLVQVSEAQEEERRRVASELHDGVAQLMVRLLYQVQVASALLERQGSVDVREELASIEKIVDANIKEVRRVMVGLGPPDLEHLGLIGAIRREVSRFDDEDGRYTLDLVGEPVDMLHAAETAVYRIVQEGLNNSRNHAKATEMNVRLEFKDQEVLLELKDDGKGFDVERTLEEALSSGHLGLWGMRQRIEALGGTLIVDSTPGSGTTISLDLPLESPQTSEVSATAR